ncbi:MAG TPA: hypothetical protein VI306_10380 [Pyrinomonadaceae bacterium]
MREEALDDVLARRFLLGQLPPEEQGRIEELAFEDRDTFEYLESVEDDLIDEFIQGDLTIVEREQFENHFLTLPDRRDNLKISEALQHHLEKIGNGGRKTRFPFLSWFKQQSLWLQISIPATALALLVLMIWTFTRVEDHSPPPIQAGPNKPQVTPSPELKVSPSLEPTTSPTHAENKQKPPAPEKPKHGASYALLFPSALVRGEGARQLKLSDDATVMTIELPLITERKFVSYEAALENESGAVIHRWSNLKAGQHNSGKGLQIDVPITLLKAQEFYRIIVSGLSPNTEKEEIAGYPFEVSK